jgi:hypothetical protein
MAAPEKPLPAKLIVGVMFSDERYFDRAVEEMTCGHGRIDGRSPEIRDEHYRFYEEEMGPGLVKRIVSFENLIDPGALPNIKIHTHSIEQELSVSGRRRINLDPGCLTLGNLVLASAKPRPRRIYLSEGIYGELELTYQSGCFQALPWTYPDFRREEVLAFLEEVRGIYVRQMKDV